LDQPFCRIDIIVNPDDASRMNFPGGKFRCYQKLINLIPPHRVYIETHLGGGAVIRFKTPAQINIGIDRDPRVLRLFDSNFGPSFKFILGTAEEFMSSYEFRGDEFVYADPPYWPTSRRSPRSPYRYSYSERDHLILLELLCRLPCNVMVSGYANEAYDKALTGWVKREFIGTSHSGAREETVWLNFTPTALHDTRYLGETFRERQSIKRKRTRWTARFRNEPLAIQQALLSDFTSIYQKTHRAHSNEN
jgi:DNA adenine methylase